MASEEKINELREILSAKRMIRLYVNEGQDGPRLYKEIPDPKGSGFEVICSDKECANELINLIIG